VTSRKHTPVRLQDVRMKPFDTVVVEHGARVLRVCRALLGPVEADDAWSETFLAALRAYPELPADANVEAWLVTIAHRKAIDAVRARARRAIPVADPADRPSDQGNPDDWDPDLTAALTALPERQRLAVVHHYLAGLPHAATAEIIGGSEAAVRRAAADGIRTLRRTYAQQDPIEERKRR
jgi:RNA polymerase sigma factor (sigma-70 family)